MKSNVYRLFFWLICWAIMTFVSILAGFVSGVMLSQSKTNIFVDKYYGANEVDNEFMSAVKKQSDKLKGKGGK